MSKQGWETYCEGARQRIQARSTTIPVDPKAPTTGQPAATTHPQETLDAVTQLRAHQATMQARQLEETQRQATEMEQARKEVRELTILIGRLRNYLIRQGSPGLSSFIVELAEPTRRCGPFTDAKGQRQYGDISEAPPVRNVQGWKIAIDSSGELSDTYLMLCPNGELWVTVNNKVYFNGSFGTGKHVLNDRSRYIIFDLYRDIIPGIARLISELGLKWDGSESAVPTPRATQSAERHQAPSPTQELAGTHTVGRVQRRPPNRATEERSVREETIEQITDLAMQFWHFMMSQDEPGLSSFRIINPDAWLKRARKAQGWTLYCYDQSASVTKRLMLDRSGNLWIRTLERKDRGKIVEGRTEQFTGPPLTKNNVINGITKLVQELGLAHQWEEWLKRH